MSTHPRWGLVLASSLTTLVISASSAWAQFAPGLTTGFEPAGPTEPVGYYTGPIQFQDTWAGGSDVVQYPRVQTETEIQAELTAAGLNPAGAVHSGTQALMVTKGAAITESTGYFVRNVFTGLEGKQNVIVDFWARPLTSGASDDPTGVTPGTANTIGERQGNTFIGIMDSSSTSAGDPATEIRAAAVRFGVDQPSGTQPVDQNITERHIDFGSASVGSAVWVKSGLLWTADTWYNFKFDLDYVAKKYDFYVNGIKANAEPIRFYDERSKEATRFFVSKGTNQAGQLLDDISIYEQVPLQGDFDVDGDVDGDDFLAWQRGLGITTGATLADGDADGDGAVDGDDLAIWKTNFASSGAVGAVGSVPEPAGVVLMLGALAVVVRRRRR
jgi:hypothetical protein